MERKIREDAPGVRAVDSGLGFSLPVLDHHPRLTRNRHLLRKPLEKLCPKPGGVILQVTIELSLRLRAIAGPKPPGRGATEPDVDEAAGRQNRRNVRLAHVLL